MLFRTPTCLPPRFSSRQKGWERPRERRAKGMAKGGKTGKRNNLRSKFEWRGSSRGCPKYLRSLACASLKYPSGCSCVSVCECARAPSATFLPRPPLPAPGLRPPSPAALRPPSQAPAEARLISIMYSPSPGPRDPPETLHGAESSGGNWAGGLH